jgi:phage protein D
MSRSALGDWDVLQVNIFRPNLPVQIRIALGLPLSEALINGFVRESKVGLSGQPGKSTFTVVGMDRTATLMNQMEASMPWPNLPDSAIAAAIFGKYGVAPLVTPTPASRLMIDTTTIQRTTDIRFLKGLAERNSFESYLQPDPLIGTDFGYFGPAKIVAPPQGVLSADFGLLSNLFDFNVSYDMLQPTTVVAATIDTMTKAPLPALAPVAAEPPMGLEPTLLRVVPPSITRPTATNAANPAEAMSMVLSIANRSSRAITGTGNVDGLKFHRVLRPGLPVLVRGVGREHSGKYYVTQVTHRITADSYTQGFSAWTNAVGLTGTEIFVDPGAAL